MSFFPTETDSWSWTKTLTVAITALLAVAFLWLLGTVIGLWFATR
jgi:hypothetical protein